MWDEYDTRRLWWLSGRLRSTISAFFATGVRIMLGDDGYTDMVRLLSVIDRVRWDDVPGYQPERDQGRRGRYYSSGSRLGGGVEYMYIDASKGIPVDTWAKKRRKAGMYPSGNGLSGAHGRHKTHEEVPRKFRNVGRSATDFIPDTDVV